MRPVVMVLSVLCCAGCLVEEARVEPRLPVGTGTGDGLCAVAGEARDGAPMEVRHGPLPFDVPASWWLRTDGGRTMLIGHGRALSPLPWWQRFPCDLAVDLWPGEVRVTAVASIEPQPVRERTPAEITAEARAHGYAP